MEILLVEQCLNRNRKSLTQRRKDAKKTNSLFAPRKTPSFISETHKGHEKWVSNGFIVSSWSLWQTNSCICWTQISLT